MGIMREPKEWQRFEQAIARYFAEHGYDLETNVVLTGRSGAPHELDVLATKSDGLTTIRVGVECKAWAAPIEKDVVTKLSVVLNDLGLNKGVVVRMQGWRTGAEQVAEDLGIDLWGPAELERHLGNFAVAQVQAGSPARSGLDWRFTAPPERAEELARSEGKGRLGLRTLEEVAWFGSVWIPAFLMATSVTEPRGRGIVKLKLGTTQVLNVHEGVSGTWPLRRARTPLGSACRGGSRACADAQPRARDTTIVSAIRKALERLGIVTQAAAVARHRATLASLGVPGAASAVSVSSSTVVHLPVYLGLPRQDIQERAVAVDGVRGVPIPQLSAVLTKRLPTYERASLRETASVLAVLP